MSNLPDDIIKIDGSKESVDSLLNYLPNENATIEELRESLRQCTGVLYQALNEIWCLNKDTNVP